MERIEDCISFLLGKAYQQVQQASKQRLAPHGVTPVQYALLRVLWERDGQTGAELGERLQLDSATITGLLDRLERAGLIERRADPGDRRVNRIFATAQMRGLQPALDQAMDEVNISFLAALATAEKAQLKGHLALLGQVAGSAPSRRE
jgi:MarR family transcriptional regulator, organic hydroperoxide resistance regulator